MTNSHDISTHLAQLPEPTLRRLPWYLALVAKLKREGVKHISSTQMSRLVGVDAAKIAKDLSFLNIKGKTRIGYEVDALESRLSLFLGFETRHNAIIVGVGSLGSALMRDKGLNRYGLDIVAGFDVNPEVVGSEILSANVYHIDRLREIVASLGVTIAAVTVPFEAAQTVTDIIVSAGIKAIWNFTPCRIQVPNGVVVQNTSIYSHLAVMYNRLSNLENDENTLD